MPTAALPFSTRLNLLQEARFEKLAVTVYPSKEVAAGRVAARIARLIRREQGAGQPAVLRLARQLAAAVLGFN